jgi:hypothetical protein
MHTLYAIVRLTLLAASSLVSVATAYYVVNG